MKERPKLGRGLPDVSKFFLSDASHQEQNAGEVTCSTFAPESLYICSPGSPLIQSIVTANLALELARHGHRVRIQDFSTSNETRLSTLMGSILFRDDRDPGKAFVRLYGLPEIMIEDGFSGDLGKEKESPHEAEPYRDDTGSLTLVNAPVLLDFIQGRAPSDEYIILTMTDEKSLLKCYAYIKVIHAHGESSRVHVVFDDAVNGINSDTVFRKFAGFINERLGFEVDYFGSLLHDEHLERSISEERPLVLFDGISITKDALIRICSLLLEGYKEGRLTEP
ncbi:MAG: hypothetical protein ABSA71_14490 [Desulfomonilia bacterium]|jgi:hypothetical protein